MFCPQAQNPPNGEAEVVYSGNFPWNVTQTINWLLRQFVIHFLWVNLLINRQHLQNMTTSLTYFMTYAIDYIYSTYHTYLESYQSFLFTVIRPDYLPLINLVLCSFYSLDRPQRNTLWFIHGCKSPKCSVWLRKQTTATNSAVLEWF